MSVEYRLQSQCISVINSQETCFCKSMKATDRQTMFYSFHIMNELTMLRSVSEIMVSVIHYSVELSKIKSRNTDTANRGSLRKTHDHLQFNAVSVHRYIMGCSYETKKRRAHTEITKNVLP